MANNDQLADLYYRRIHSTRAQDACRDRVHWLCEHADGRHILDVGCSQGIAAIILAREGRTVIGLDIENAAIEGALEELDREPEEVRRRVTFRVADAFTVDFEPGFFDAVILGEVLEHLASPERLLERVSKWLRPGGRVVISIPHGYEPFDDHKRTFYSLRLVELLSQYFDVTDVEPVRGKYLCAVGLRGPDGQPASPPPADKLLTWTRRCEKGLELVQRAAHEEKITLQADRKMLGERAAEYREKVKALTAQAQQACSETELARKQEQLTRSSLTGELAEVRRLWKETTRRETALPQRLAELEKSRAAAVEEQKHLRESLKQIDHERDRRRRAEAQVERLQTQADYYKAELTLREQEVRYRLGDALVRAARPSLDTLKLPVRIVRLLFEGLRRRTERRREGKPRRPNLPRTPPAGPRTAKTPLPGQPPATADRKSADKDRRRERPAPGDTSRATALEDLGRIPTLAEPFSVAPLELRRRDDLRIAAVTDEFSWRAWQYEAEVYTFTPKTWQEVLEERKPDVLFIESTWSGLNDTWYFQLRDFGKRGEVIGYYAVPDVVAWCRERQIPTVFYNKEDPPNFEVFVAAAKEFDYVFTSDANCIPEYRKHLGHDRVFALPFAAQPRIHNPMMTGTRAGSVCFAGTWYAHRHFGRHDDAKNILRPALDFDLHIFDRMAHSDNPNYRWPDEFLTSVRGAVPYSQMLAAYKRYRVFLNVNSVKDSPTMFSRRVFELLACGTPVISSYSQGIEALLGTDVVLMSDNQKTTRELLERVLGDDEYRERLSLRGQRKVLAEHTYTHRLQSVLDAIGLERPAAGRPVMTMIAVAQSPQQLTAAWEAFCRQNYPQKRLVVCTTEPAASENADRITNGDGRVRVVAAKGALSGRLMQDVLSGCEEGFVAALNPSHYYGPHYLTDYANATLYVTEAAIGKATFYHAENGAEPSVVKPGSEYRVTSEVPPWTLCLSRTQALQAAGTLVDAQTPYEWWNRAMRRLNRAYSSDRFNYVERDPAGAAPPGASLTALGQTVSEPRELEAALA